MRNARFYQAALVGLLALGVRFYRLDAAPLWTDEIFSWAAAHLPPARLISFLLEGNNPPLWELLLHGWLRLWGEGEIALRSLPAIFSAATAVMLFWLGTHTGGKWAGWMAALLWIFSDYGQSIGREGRAYALLGLLTLLTHAAFLRWRTQGKGAFLWALLAWLLFHTHYLGGTIIAFHLACLIAQRAWKPLRAGLAYLLPGIALSGIIFLDRLIAHSQSETGAFASLEGFYNMLWRFSNQPVPTVLALLSVVSGLVWTQGRLLRSYPYLAFWGIFLPLWLAAHIAPVWQARYLMPAAVAYYWVLGHTVSALPPVGRWISSFTLLTAWGISWNPTPPGPIPFHRELGQLIAQKPAQHYLVAMPAWITLEWLPYLPLKSKSRFSADYFSETQREMYLRHRVIGASHYTELPVCELQAADTLWILDYNYAWSFPHGILPALLRKEWQPVRMYEFGNGVKLWIGVRAEGAPSS